MPTKDYYEYTICYDCGETKETYYGITYGDSFNEVMDNLTESYDTTNVVSIRIEPIGINGCLELSKSALEDLRIRGI